MFLLSLPFRHSLGFSRQHWIAFHAESTRKKKEDDNQKRQKVSSGQFQYVWPFGHVNKFIYYITDYKFTDLNGGGEGLVIGYVAAGVDLVKHFFNQVRDFVITASFAIG